MDSTGDAGASLPSALEGGVGGRPAAVGEPACTLYRPQAAECMDQALEVLLEPRKEGFRWEVELTQQNGTPHAKTVLYTTDASATAAAEGGSAVAFEERYAVKELQTAMVVYLKSERTSELTKTLVVRAMPDNDADRQQQRRRPGAPKFEMFNVLRGFARSGPFGMEDTGRILLRLVRQFSGVVSYLFTARVPAADSKGVVYPVNPMNSMTAYDVSVDMNDRWMWFVAMECSVMEEEYDEPDARDPKAMYLNVHVFPGTVPLGMVGLF